MSFAHSIRCSVFAILAVFLSTAVFTGCGKEKEEEDMPAFIEFDEKELLRSAEQGDANAQIELAFFYMIRGGENYEKAVEWLRKAAEQGDDNAEIILADCYFNGTGVKQDKAEAVKIYRKYAKMEDVDPEIVYKLANCYYNGEGVEQNKAEAVRLYSILVQCGLWLGEYELGRCYENGEGVDQDKDKAIKLYRRAAEHENENAIAALKRLGIE